MQNLIFESSFTGLLRLILIAIIIYYVFSLLVRYILPQILKNSVRNYQKTYYDQNARQNETTKKKEGEVTIEYVDDKTKGKKAHSDDEYVDFEEIK